MIIEVRTTSHEGGVVRYFEAKGMSEEEIKERILEVMKETYWKIFNEEKKALLEIGDDEDPVVNIERVVSSEYFVEEMEKRGFKLIKPDLSFVFWGWNSNIHIWDIASSELDYELLDRIFGKIEEVDSDG